jgi:mannose-6-phosphate isomerase-like protein (cupin superfamily)
MLQADIKIGLSDAAEILKNSGNEFIELFGHGSLSVELYKPKKVDTQQRHIRDEIYVVVSGSGMFFCDGQTMSFERGDFLFVPAGVKHRFEDFTDDFMSWVMFFGPEGGEK